MSLLNGFEQEWSFPTLAGGARISIKDLSFIHIFYSTVVEISDFHYTVIVAKRIHDIIAISIENLKNQSNSSWTLLCIFSFLANELHSEYSLLCCKHFYFNKQTSCTQVYDALVHFKVFSCCLIFQPLLHQIVLKKQNSSSAVFCQS